MDYADDDAIARLAAAFLDRSLPTARWSHAAHFATALWLLRHRPDPVPETAMPGLIRAYNEANGGVNSDTSGYHETITRTSLRAARAALVRHDPVTPLTIVLSDLMASPLGNRDWLLAYWTRSRLFSVEARREWIEPDIGPLPW